MNYKILVNKVYPYNKEMFNNVILKKIINDIAEEYVLEKRTLKAYLELKKDLEKDIYRQGILLFMSMRY